MSPPSSVLFVIEDIPDAGRGVIATRSVGKGVVVLESGPPVAHVVFKQYRREVCARCFHYDRGRSMPLRHTRTGKIFCTAECRAAWSDGEGELGVTAWESLHAFVQARSKNVMNTYDCLPDRGTRPSREDVEATWIDAEDQERTRRTMGKKIHKSNSKPVDPDILAYMLSSILFHSREPELWQRQVCSLALDHRPYRSGDDLSMHAACFLQLCRILPEPLLCSCTPEVCHTAVAAASHNSFGIRSKDGEEYMGYALYPQASYFNHSCVPNITKARVGSEWTFEAHRDIESGEQCCITYMGGDEKEMSVEERRARLDEHWGFYCMCGKCCDESRMSSV